MKKALALLIYILVFTAVPVFFLWTQDVQKVERVPIEDESMYDPAMLDQLHKLEIDIAKTSHMIQGTIVALGCFFISVWISFGFAIAKAITAERASTLFSMGIWGFNVIYLPVSVSILWGSPLGFYSFYRMGGAMLYVVGIVFFILLAVMLVSLILNIIGMVKGRKMEKFNPQLNKRNS